MISIFRSSYLFAFTIFVGMSAPVLAEEYLTGEKLRELLVGNTVTGTYMVEGVQVIWHEYMSADGALHWADENGYESGGRWEIRDDGCSYANYDDGNGDGCYYYKDNGDGSFSVKRPDANAPPGTQKILSGNPKNLGK
jgi:hypothetical protein